MYVWLIRQARILDLSFRQPMHNIDILITLPGLNGCCHRETVAAIRETCVAMREASDVIIGVNASMEAISP